MDHQGHGPADNNQQLYGTNMYETRHSDGPGGATQLPPNQLAYQHIHQQQQLLQQQLQTLWTNHYQENEKTIDFKNHSLPLARIKKIMKADEDVRMISAEAPIVFARACEMFILELTLRSWNHTEENKRRTLQRNDIAAAIMRTDIFDFLVDIVPRDDNKEEGLESLPRGIMMPVGPPSDSISYCYMPQDSSQVGNGHPGMIMNKSLIDPMLYTQQPYTYLPPQMWSHPPPPQQSKSSSDS